MKLLKYYEMQEKLDEHIFIKKNHQRENTLDARILAATIELAEVANEVRSFKFWSNKGMDFEKAIEEYVDVMHFLMSIGIDLDARLNESVVLHEQFEITDLFLKLFSLFSKLHQEKSKEVYHQLLKYFFTLAKHLDFTEKCIETEYLKKHQINYERQKNGY